MALNVKQKYSGTQGGAAQLYASDTRLSLRRREQVFTRLSKSYKENMDISSTSSSSDEEMIVLLNEERRRKRRRYWIHPIVARREEHGEFYRLVQELKMYHARFRGYFRMSVSEFEHLLQQLAPSLTKEHTHYRKPIDPEQRLAVCLRWVRLHWYSLQWML